ncbi:PI-stichotoxin-She2a-like [Spodoptera litura]|uniref:PI-stichotoxin-She2a-like n=1 Tax=Spodoptera litura TaxID=69820 RepID=A0A9J7IJB7_SPOLT|nr:PI-stichotoxin-She2a-like [Spodoptera litura]
MKVFLLLTILALKIVASSTQDARCSQPMDVGTCNLALVRYYYDSERSMCHAFIYTGCGGNSNLFRTARECRQACL